MASNTSKESKDKSEDEMSFKNSAIKTINSLMSENKKLRDSIGKSKNTRKESSAGRIQGLRTLKNTLGRQFMKDTD